MQLSVDKITLYKSIFSISIYKQAAVYGLMCLLLFLPTLVQAQTTNVTFKIINVGREPLSFASVTVHPVNDSLHSQQKVSDSSGTVLFQLSKGLPYVVKISSVNYAPFQKGITVSDRSLITIVAEERDRTLNSVVVTATKPLIRQEDDKMIVDPENLALSSTNAYEIIEKTPGLFVDQDGNIYLSSTTPASIYINGREQKMSTADIATMLKSLPPNSIASIEILRTPSAKYDASGSGGIVNVVLRKGVKIGLTGSVNSGFNQGTYGNQFIGANLNNNNGKTTTYLNLQYSRRNTYDRIQTDRLFASDSLLSQDAFTKYPISTYYVGYGLNYTLNKKWELNYDGRVSYNGSTNFSSNQSLIKQISTDRLATENRADVHNKNNSWNITQGVSSKYKWDEAGSEWTTDLSYNYAPNTSRQFFTTLFYVPAIPNAGGDGDIDNKLSFFTFQTNLVKKLPKQFTVETGLKATYVQFKNSTAYFNQVDDYRLPDNFRTGSYRYNENINAAYVQASKSIHGIVIKAGTRLENTNMKGRQLTPKDTSFTIHRSDFFPYVYISRSVMKIMGYDLKAYLVYRRTISRPAYEYLNPSPRYVDPYLFETGNPSLRPQFTQNYEANISVDERPIFAIGVNDTKDIFSNVIYQADSSHSQAFRTYDNLGNNKEFYLRGLGAIPPGKKYFLVVGAQYNHNFYQGLYEGKPLLFKRGSWTFFTYQTLKLGKRTQLTVNGFARFNGQLQFYELSSFGALNMSLNQQFLNKKLVVSVSATDLFFTNNNHFTLQQGSVNASGYREGDTRRFGLNVRYNFGFRKKEENNLFNVESPERGN